MVSFTSNRKIKATGVMMGYLPLQSPALYLHGGDGASLQPFLDKLSAIKSEKYEEKMGLKPRGKTTQQMLALSCDSKTENGWIMMSR